MGNHSLLQGLFLTQGLNPGLLHCRRILYCLRHQGSPGQAQALPLTHCVTSSKAVALSEPQFPIWGLEFEASPATIAPLPPRRFLTAQLDPLADPSCPQVIRGTQWGSRAGGSPSRQLLPLKGAPQHCRPSPRCENKRPCGRSKQGTGREASVGGRRDGHGARGGDGRQLEAVPIHQSAVTAPGALRPPAAQPADHTGCPGHPAPSRPVAPV